MNISELARQLRINPQELRNHLPQFGYDIGQKAIKVNRNVANKIIRDWPRLRRQIQLQKDKEEEEAKQEKVKVEANTEINIPAFITVKEFAVLANIPINIVLGELMKNGIISSLNEKIDYETAWLVGSELGFKVSKKENDEAAEEVSEENKITAALKKEKNLVERPPVVVVMGHVDHGKTKLLDAIRKSHVIDGEAGGITQHIGAYQTEKNGKLTTFIDTPGHEAFTAMRSRGARIADIAILVVAADDGVKPQTVEAFRIIKAAKIPYVVAINKIDKPDANIDKVKQELSSKLGIVPEDWGGKIICVPISALKGTGIDELLDMVLLAAETESGHIQANPLASAMGTVIESHVDKGAGPVATILVQNGTMKSGDKLCSNNISVGKVRGLKDYRGDDIITALPSTPAQIIGFKTLPQVGDVIEVGNGDRVKFKKYKGADAGRVAGVGENIEENGQAAKTNIVIKSDVLGSAEAIEESLEKINTKEVMVNIIHKGLGNITDGDIKRAEASGALIVGFNVKLPPAMEDVAREKNVEIKLYSIIYDLINDIKERMQNAIAPTVNRIDLGCLTVMAIFRTEKKVQILGGKVKKGHIENNVLVEILRNKEIIGEGKITSLQSGKQEVSQVEKGEECGLRLQSNVTVEENDILQFYKNEE
ncbi:MAG: translation initiation factor IF-2, partial [Elusimicrobiales bacterium]|nr:translation initiation factor IF-2 [Elusimicrobiales bacterium]